MYLQTVLGLTSVESRTNFRYVLPAVSESRLDRLHQKYTVFQAARLLCRTFFRLPWVGLREGRRPQAAAFRSIVIRYIKRHSADIEAPRISNISLSALHSFDLAELDSRKHADFSNFHDFVRIFSYDQC
jgi:hypothetical protein